MTGDAKRRLGHVDDHGRVRMVDVGDKDITRRSAIAEGWIRMEPSTLAAVRENEIRKGHVLAVAQIAGISAGKRASEWIPLCHPLYLTVLVVSLTPDDDLPGIRVEARAAVTASAQ